jgi:two-component system sensor histidine kinase KdpD
MKSIVRYALPAVALAIVVALLAAARTSLNQTSIALLLVLAVVMVAVFGGRGPGLCIAIAAGLAFNFYFLPPFHSFTIHAPQDAVAFVVFIATAIVVGQLATRLQRRTLQAAAQRQELDRAEQEAASQAIAAEGLRRSEQLKGALLDAVTHDLRTPLTSIKAAATTLRGTLLPDARAELCDVVEQEADRLDHFVQGMVDLAQLRGGHLTLNNRSVTADEIIENAVLRAGPLVQDREITVTADPQLLLQADPRLIAQVLFSLLENAAKFSPPGSRIAVAAEPSGNDVCFSVADEGSGIAPEEREKVFDHFYRGGASSGTGMGLAIARGIVVAHGGRIWVEDGIGGGTRLRFNIPMGNTA